MNIVCCFANSGHTYEPSATEMKQKGLSLHRRARRVLGLNGPGSVAKTFPSKALEGWHGVFEEVVDVMMSLKICHRNISEISNTLSLD